MYGKSSPASVASSHAGSSVDQKVTSTVLNQNEAKLVEQLKALCDETGKEKDPKQTAKILQSIGNIYYQRSPDKLCLIQAAALLNAAIVRTEDKTKIETDLQSLHKHILFLAGCKNTDEDLQKLSKKCFECVNIMRKNANLSLQTLTEKSSAQDEMAKIDYMEQLQGNIANDYTLVMKEISLQCIKLLGPAPCKFCLVGIGSLARSEITPYSDFESVIVLDDNVRLVPNYESMVEYFRNYAMIFQVIVLGFGETIIPSVAVPTLNDFETPGGDWFFDVHTPRGVSFDGFMPHACKSPLGRQRETKNKPWKLELIQPVSKMAELLQLDHDIKNGYHLSEILTLIRFVDGEPKLFDDFFDRVQNHVQVMSEVQSQMLVRQIKEDLDTFAVFNNLPNVYTNKKINIKRVLYRSTTLFVSTLGRIHGISSPSSFQILRELEIRGVISQNAKNNLMFAVAIACEVRLKVYMYKKGQDEWLSMDDENTGQQENESNIIQTVGLDNILRYFKVAFCLQRSVRSGQQITYHADMQDVGKDVDVAICYYFKQYKRVIELCEELRQTYLANEDDKPKVAACTSLIANCFFHLEKYESSLFERKKEIGYRTKDVYSENEQYALAVCRKAAGRCLFKLLRYEDAIEEHLKEKELLNPTSKDFATCLENIGSCYFQMELYNKALQTFREQFSFQATMFKEVSEEQAECLTNIAGCLFRLEEYQEALDSYIKSKDIQVDLSKSDSTIADCHCKIAHCYFKLQIVEKALKNYKEEIKLLKIEQDVDQSRLFDAYSNVAGCCYSLELFSESILYHKLQLELSDNLQGTDKPAIKGRIAHCHMKMQDYDQAQEMYKSELADRQKSKNKSVADEALFAKTVENLTFCLLHLGRSQEAVDLFQLHIGNIRQL